MQVCDRGCCQIESCSYLEDREQEFQPKAESKFKASCFDCEMTNRCLSIRLRIQAVTYRAGMAELADAADSKSAGA